MTTYSILHIGDSICAGTATGGVSYPEYMADYGVPTNYSKLADAGWTLDTFEPFNLAGYIPAEPAQGILISLLGINDGGEMETADVFLASYASFLDAQKIAGWSKIIVIPLLSFNGRNTWRNSINPTMLTWVGTHADAIVPSNDPLLWSDSAYQNTDYFISGIHPTLLGFQLLAKYVAQTVVKLVAVAPKNLAFVLGNGQALKLGSGPLGPANRLT